MKTELDSYAAAKFEAATKMVADINIALKSCNVQFCMYSARHVIKKGAVIVLASDCSMKVNGKGDAFLFGAFTAYKYG